MLDSKTCVHAVVEEDGLHQQYMTTKRYKRNLNELEARRRKGMRMLARGIAQAEVARQLGVSRQAVSTWASASAEDDQAWRRKPLGRPAVLSASQKKRLGKVPGGGGGYWRALQRTLDIDAYRSTHSARIRGRIQCKQRVADFEVVGVLQSAPRRPGDPTR